MIKVGRNRKFLISTNRKILKTVLLNAFSFRRRLTKRLTAGVSGTLTTVLLHGGQLLIRLAELPHAAARGQAWGVAPIRLAPTREAPLQELLLVVLLLRRRKKKKKDVST